MSTASCTSRGGSSRRWIRRMTLAGLLLVPVVALPAGAQDGLNVTTPVRMTTEDASPARTYQSPMLTFHPERESTVFASSTDMRAGKCRLMRSRDTGHSWEMMDASPMPDPEANDCFHTGGTINQTPIDWGADGRLYYGLTSYPEENGHQRANMNVLVGRSEDFGESWTTTMVRDSTEEGTEEEPEGNRITSLAAEPRNGDDDVVYVAWSRLEPHTTLAVSTDGGESFSDPIRPFNDEIAEELSGEGEDEALSTGRALLHVDHNDTLNATFRADPGAEDEEARLVVARSDDQAESFTWNEVDGQVETAVWAYPMLTSSPEGGEDGSLHLVYEAEPDRGEGARGTRDIYYQRSTDGGENWTEPVVLNDDGPDSLAGQYNANIDVAPNGRVDVVWYDFRDGQENFANDVYYTYSNDNGDTWSDNVRVTDQSVNRHVGPWSNDADMRAPAGIASRDDFVLTAWSDTRNADQAGQSQDVYSAAVQHDDLGAGGASTLRVVLAAVGGLFAAGVLLFGVGLGIRLRGSNRPATAGS